MFFKAEHPSVGIKFIVDVNPGLKS